MSVSKISLTCFALAATLALLGGQASAQSIVNRIDTFHEGIFSLSNTGAMHNIDSISTVSSDLFDTREAEINVQNNNGQIIASLDSFVSPSVHINAQNNDFLARYFKEDASTTDLTAGGATGLLLQLEEQVVGQRIDMFAVDETGGAIDILTLTGASEYYVPFSQFGFVDFQNIVNVGFHVIDTNTTAGDYVVDGFYTAAIPEPGSGLLLAALSLIGLVGCRRRRITAHRA